MSNWPFAGDINRPNPNIVVVPTMSFCNDVPVPPSAKKQKLDTIPLPQLPPPPPFPPFLENVTLEDIPVPPPPLPSDKQIPSSEPVCESENLIIKTEVPSSQDESKELGNPGSQTEPCRNDTNMKNPSNKSWASDYMMSVGQFHSKPIKLNLSAKTIPRRSDTSTKEQKPPHDEDPKTYQISSTSIPNKKQLNTDCNLQSSTDKKSKETPSSSQISPMEKIKSIVPVKFESAVEKTQTSTASNLTSPTMAIQSSTTTNPCIEKLELTTPPGVSLSMDKIKSTPSNAKCSTKIFQPSKTVSHENIQEQTLNKINRNSLDEINPIFIESQHLTGLENPMKTYRLNEMFVETPPNVFYQRMHYIEPQIHYNYDPIIDRTYPSHDNYIRIRGSSVFPEIDYGYDLYSRRSGHEYLPRYESYRHVAEKSYLDKVDNFLAKISRVSSRVNSKIVEKGKERYNECIPLKRKSDSQPQINKNHSKCACTHTISECKSLDLNRSREIIDYEVPEKYRKIEFESGSSDESYVSEDNLNGLNRRRSEESLFIRRRNVKYINKSRGDFETHSKSNERSDMNKHQNQKDKRSLSKSSRDRSSYSFERHRGSDDISLVYSYHKVDQRDSKSTRNESNHNRFQRESRSRSPSHGDRSPYRSRQNSEERDYKIKQTDVSSKSFKSQRINRTLIQGDRSPYCSDRRSIERDPKQIQRNSLQYNFKSEKHRSHYRSEKSPDYSHIRSDNRNYKRNKGDWSSNNSPQRSEYRDHKINQSDRSPNVFESEGRSSSLKKHDKSPQNSRCRSNDRDPKKRSSASLKQSERSPHNSHRKSDELDLEIKQGNQSPEGFENKKRCLSLKQRDRSPHNSHYRSHERHLKLNPGLLKQTDRSPYNSHRNSEEKDQKTKDEQDQKTKDDRPPTRFESERYSRSLKQNDSSPNFSDHSSKDSDQKTKPDDGSSYYDRQNRSLKQCNRRSGERDRNHGDKTLNTFERKSGCQSQKTVDTSPHPVHRKSQEIERKIKPPVKEKISRPKLTREDKKSYKILKELIKSKIEKTKVEIKKSLLNSLKKSEKTVLTKLNIDTSTTKNLKCSDETPNSSLKSVVRKHDTPYAYDKSCEHFDLRSKLSRKCHSDDISGEPGDNLQIKDTENDLKKRDKLLITVDNDCKDETSVIEKTVKPQIIFEGNKDELKNKGKKVKLVIKVVCESSETSDTDEVTENESISKPSTEDLSFLDDFNVDEIVNSLIIDKNDSVVSKSGKLVISHHKETSNKDVIDDSNTDDFHYILISDEESNASTVHLDDLRETQDLLDEKQNTSMNIEKSFDRQRIHIKSEYNCETAICSPLTNTKIKTEPMDVEETNTLENTNIVLNLPGDARDNQNDKCVINGKENNSIKTDVTTFVDKEIKSEPVDPEDTSNTKENQCIALHLPNVNIDNEAKSKCDIFTEVKSEDKIEIPNYSIGDSINSNTYSNIEICSKSPIAISPNNSCDDTEVRNKDIIKKDFDKGRILPNLAKSILNNEVIESLNKTTNIQTNDKNNSKEKNENTSNSENVEIFASVIAIEENNIVFQKGLATENHTRLDDPGDDEMVTVTKAMTHTTDPNTSDKIEEKLTTNYEESLFEAKEYVLSNYVNVKEEKAKYDLEMQLSLQSGTEQLHKNASVFKGIGATQNNFNKTNNIEQLNVNSVDMLKQCTSNNEATFKESADTTEGGFTYLKDEQHPKYEPQLDVSINKQSIASYNLVSPNTEDCDKNTTTDLKNEGLCENAVVNVTPAKESAPNKNPSETSSVKENNPQDLYNKVVEDPTNNNKESKVKASHSPLTSTNESKSKPILDTPATIKVENSKPELISTTIKLKSPTPDIRKPKNSKNCEDRFIIQLEHRMLKCLNESYRVLSTLHQGKFSTIFRCQKASGDNIAVKVMRSKSLMTKSQANMLKMLQADIPNENLHLVRILDGFAINCQWSLVMEYYPKNLSQALEENKSAFHINIVQRLSMQLAAAIFVLRNNNIVHSDIKPGHILLNATNNCLKLCGFDAVGSYKQKSLPCVGSLNYRAPEVILGISKGFSIDVWSAAVVMYEMATNRKLFYGQYNNEILLKQMGVCGFVPLDMIQQSPFAYKHFRGPYFMRKTGEKGKDIVIISREQLYRNNKLRGGVLAAYHSNVGENVTIKQKRAEMAKVYQFIDLLYGMLTMHPMNRLPIEYVYSHKFFK